MGYSQVCGEQPANSKAYHIEELRIAASADDPRRTLPPISPGFKRILDVGCGAGQTLIASHVGPGVIAIGVDLDLAALRLGRELGTHIHFVCATGEELPFKDAHFDLVISRVSLPYMRASKALPEIARVTRPGGSLWMVLHPFSMVWRQLRSSVLSLNLADVVFRLYVIANGLFFHFWGKEFVFPRGRRCESFQTAKGIKRALRAAGFDDIKVCEEQHFVVTAKRSSGS